MSAVAPASPGIGAAALLEPTQSADGACAICGHPTSAHDRIAARYCDATQINALSRRCICPQDAAPTTPGMTLTRG